MVESGRRGELLKLILLACLSARAGMTTNSTISSTILRMLWRTAQTTQLIREHPMMTMVMCSTINQIPAPDPAIRRHNAYFSYGKFS